MVPGVQRPLMREIRKAAGGKFVRYEVEVADTDGKVGTFDFSLKPVFDDAGQVVLLVPEGRDISERKRTEETQRFLAEASNQLASSLDYALTLQRVASLAVPTLADWCTVDLAEGDASLRCFAVAHVDPAKEVLLHEMTCRFPRDGAAEPVVSVLHTGTPRIIPEIPERMLVGLAQDGEHHAIRRGRP